VVEGAPLRQSATSREPGFVKVTSFQPMCGSFSGPGSSARNLSGHDARPAAPPLSVEESKASCMPRQIPRTGVPARTRSRSSSSRPSPLSRSIARAKAPTPGTTSRRPTGAVGITADARAGADVLERLLDGAAVTHAVVDDRDLDGLLYQRRHAVSVPFVLGTPVSVGRSPRPRAARARRP